MGDVVDLGAETQDVDYAEYMAQLSGEAMQIVVEHMRQMCGKVGHSEALRDLAHLVAAHASDLNDWPHDHLDTIVFTPEPDDADV